MSAIISDIPVSGLSALFSLSDAAAKVPPMPVGTTEPVKTASDSKDLASGKNGSHTLKHRRLSSTSQTRRRMSDARDAVSRPIAANLSAASALASLSSLSLTPSGITSSVSSSHNLHSHHHVCGRPSISQPNFAPSAGANRTSGTLASSVPETSYVQDMASSVADDIEVDVEDFDDAASTVESTTGRATDKKSNKSAKVKKRGTIFQCESCSKVYRHPSCLVKHRWEHSPHWREASKFMLSKHQQVQLLEAATILSHLDPGSSLPEDRSYWPSFLSNGSLPPPSNENTLAMNPQVTTVNARPGVKSASSSFSSQHPISSSVPIYVQAPRLDRNRSGSVTSTGSGITCGPRMHDYTVPGGITQIRPGLLAHQTTATAPTSALSRTSISPYADEDSDGKDDKSMIAPYPTMDVVSPTKPKPVTVPITVSNNRHTFEVYRDSGSAFSVGSGSVSASLAHSGGWSLPRSDLRSSSVARSYSGSRSGDEEDVPHSAMYGSEDDLDVDVDVDVADAHRDRFSAEARYTGYAGAGFGFVKRRSGKEPVVKEEVDDNWEDSMEMEL